MTLKLNFAASQSQSKTDWIEYFNDFIGFAAADWTITTTEAGAGTASEAVGDAKGGVLVITNDDGASDADYLKLAAETFTFEASKKLYFGARWKVSDADGCSAIMGLHVSDTSPLDAANGLFFSIDDDTDSALDFKAVSSDASTTEKAAVHTVADDTFMVTEFYYDGNDTIELYIDGEAAGSLPITNAPTTELTVGFGLLGASDVMSVDWVRVMQER